MRRLLLLLLVLSGCPDGQLDQAGAVGGDDGYGNGGAAPQCFTAEDCAFAAAKCCDCPTYAAPKSDPAIEACLGVACPGGPNNPACPQNVALACNAGKCELACVAMACAESCADGYAVDASGCLSCTCAEVTAPACSDDGGCVEATGDCCGCARGGADTAVAADQLQSYLAGLDCPANPACPGNNTCDPSQGPACVQGSCRLVAPAPAEACGRPDLPACGAGEQCVVNADAAATAHAVGVCQALP